jgi:hypothetical protein
MNYYTAPFAATADSAIATAAICYRQSRRDVAKLTRWGRAIATHPRTIQAAKLTVCALYVAAVVAYALGQTARIGWDYLVARIDLEVQQAQCQENPAPAIQPAPTVEAAPIETAPQAQAISATAAPAAARATTAQAKPRQARSRRAKPSAAPSDRAGGGRGRRKAAAG